MSDPVSENIKALEKIDQELSDPQVDPELALVVFDNLPDAVIIVDSLGVVRRLNKQAEHLFGYHRSEVIGQPIELLMPASAREAHVRHVQTYLTDPKVRPMRTAQEAHAQEGNPLLGLTKEGLQFWVDVSLSPIVTKHGKFVIAAIRADLNDPIRA